MVQNVQYSIGPPNHMIRPFENRTEKVFEKWKVHISGTVGIRLANIRITETFELQTFSSLFEWSQPIITQPIFTQPIIKPILFNI